MRRKALAVIDRSEAEFRLAEYDSLRSEINRRSEAQFNLIALTLTAFGTLAGIALAAPVNAEQSRLLLLLPVLSACMGLLWLDHDGSIQEIGDYIRDDLWPADLPTFEDRADQRARGGAILVEFVAPVLLVFTIPAIVGLSLNRDDQQEALWCIGAVITCVYVLYGLWCFLRRWRAARPRHHRV